MKQAMIRAVDNEAATKWTATIGEENTNPANSSYSVGFSVVQVSQSVNNIKQLNSIYISSLFEYLK